MIAMIIKEKFTKPQYLSLRTLILYNFLVIILISNIFSIDIFNEKFLNNSREIFVFIFGSVIFYLIGLFDDKYIFNLIKNYSINSVYFYIINYRQLYLLRVYVFKISTILDLNTFSIPFSILCLLLFLNALNMFDGINFKSPLFYFIA